MKKIFKNLLFGGLLLIGIGSLAACNNTDSSNTAPGNTAPGNTAPSVIEPTESTKPSNVVDYTISNFVEFQDLWNKYTHKDVIPAENEKILFLTYFENFDEKVNEENPYYQTIYQETLDSFFGTGLSTIVLEKDDLIYINNYFFENLNKFKVTKIYLLTLDINSTRDAEYLYHYPIICENSGLTVLNSKVETNSFDATPVNKFIKEYHLNLENYSNNILKIINSNNEQ